MQRPTVSILEFVVPNSHPKLSYMDAYVQHIIFSYKQGYPAFYFLYLKDMFVWNRVT